MDFPFYCTQPHTGCCVRFFYKINKMLPNAKWSEYLSKTIPVDEGCCQMLSHLTKCIYICYCHSVHCSIMFLNVKIWSIQPLLVQRYACILTQEVINWVSKSFDNYFCHYPIWDSIKKKIKLKKLNFDRWTVKMRTFQGTHLLNIVFIVLIIRKKSTL